jgi:acetoin:2,6-dichlorophenolindophenol oxidoreductase subunit alpha
MLRGTGQVAVAFFGDGATNIGAFHEALNLAAVWKLPVIFICENNLYMEYTPISSVTAVPNPAADRAASYGLASRIIDGNDVAVVHQAVAEAAAAARAGQGPALIEARTYRHFGHSRTDPARYRPEDEVREWLERDPLILARHRLAALGVAGEQIDAADARAERVVADAVEEARAAPDADPAEALTDVWADGSATWRT